VTFSYVADEETVGDTDTNKGDAGNHAYPTASGSEDRITPVGKSNTSSVIRNYFGFPSDKFGHAIDDGKPQCGTCFKEIQSKSSNTTILFKHLRDKYPKLYSESQVKRYV